jgi:hypothetical protein
MIMRAIVLGIAIQNLPYGPVRSLDLGHGAVPFVG